ncbi:MAG: hypothetical protein COA52_02450 [Hyphomicrobiales bacterium]|nr:MAG: hypothetical protein COA52_02450 [Hyphomicrobiales bacterium]
MTPEQENTLALLEAGTHVLVPKKASRAMLTAGASAWLADPERRSTTLYRAMIQAAQEEQQ